MLKGDFYFTRKKTAADFFSSLCFYIIRNIEKEPLLLRMNPCFLPPSSYSWYIYLEKGAKGECKQTPLGGFSIHLSLNGVSSFAWPTLLCVWLDIRGGLLSENISARSNNNP